MSGKKGMKHYPLEVKLEAVRLFLEVGLTKAEIRERLGLTKGRVKIWVRQYRREGAAAFARKGGGPGRRPKRENKDAYIARLEMENELLKKLHAELRREELGRRNIGSSTSTENDIE